MGANVGRRLIDVVASLVGLVLAGPLLLAVALAIKLNSPGPVLHLARRVGRDGRLFSLYKFRTMVAGAHLSGPAVTRGGDRRVTTVGRFLRRTKLDELPQLLNVLNGDMSLVGPRPEDPRYVELYTATQRKVLRARPGLTGAASLAYRDESSLLSGEDWEDRYVREILPHKAAIDLEYLAHRTVLKDLGIVFRTLLALRRGALPVAAQARQAPGESSTTRTEL